MSKKGGGSTSASDIASAQSGANSAASYQTALLSNPNIVSPYGNISYTPDWSQGGTWVGDPHYAQEWSPKRYTQTVTLSPDQQKILDLTQQGQIGLGEVGVGQLGNIASALSPKLDFSQFGGVPGSQDAGGIDSLTNALMERLNPQLDRTRAARENQLANQGIVQGSEAWRNAQDDLARSENDARLSAITQGDQAEQTRQLQARNQQIAELLQQRSVPINEITALLSGGQVQMPSSAGYQSQATQPVDFTSIYNTQNALNAQNSGQSGALLGQGLGTLAQLGMMFI